MEAVVDCVRTNAWRKRSPGRTACQGGAYVARLRTVTARRTADLRPGELGHLVPDLAVVGDLRKDEDEGRRDDARGRARLLRTGGGARDLNPRSRGIVAHVADSARRNHPGDLHRRGDDARPPSVREDRPFMSATSAAAPAARAGARPRPADAGLRPVPDDARQLGDERLDRNGRRGRGHDRDRHPGGDHRRTRS